MSVLLVTGGSGFIGSHVVLQLRQANHTVRTTVRSLKRGSGVRDAPRSAGADAGNRLTLSCGAIYYGYPPQTAPFDERSWTNLDGAMSDYVRSKAIAERAAWDFMAAEGGALELSVVNPAGVFGPVLSGDVSSSVDIITRLVKGGPGCPRIYFAVVDVRDVADLHVRAMTDPAAKGERFIATTGPAMSMLDIAKFLRARLGDAASKVPTRQLPDFLVRLVALVNPQMRGLLPLLGKIRNATSAKAERVLGWRSRPVE
jgi:dihydroflavonol-4-reductase